jgi:DNA polymerase-3 subunit delta'
LAQREFFKRLWFSKKLSPTAILAGPPGIGKFLAAQELSATVLCQERCSTQYGGCGACKSCETLSHGNHPDFHYVDCNDAESASMAGLRALLYELNLTAFSAGNRVVVFRDADELSLQAANLLLKTLEEPRAGTYFMLTCSNPARLPATLLSRCQLIYFDNLAKDQVVEILKTKPDLLAQANEAGLGLEQAALLADGSMEGLQALLSSLSTWEEVKAILAGLEKNDATLALEAAYKLGHDKELLAVALKCLRIEARQRLLGPADAAARAAWAVFLSNLLTAERLIFERNLSATYVLNVLFVEGLAPQEQAFTRFTNSATLLSQLTV